jgi:putative lipoic acid-binding regulatory protein
MLPKENPEEFYSRFQDQLKDSQEWPGPFMFKFIIRGDDQKVKKLREIFEGTNAKFKLKKSSKKTFVSVSFLATMENPISVIDVYKKTSSIEGIITL